MYPDIKIRFHWSRTILYAHSDSLYLSINLAWSRITGYFFLANDFKKPEDAKPNRVIDVASTILKNIIASAAKIKIALTFNNAKDNIPLWHVLKFLCYY